MLTFYSQSDLRVKCVSAVAVAKGCFVCDLHTGECIHGCYFIAGPSIHTVGDVHPFAKLSMICSNKVTFQIRVKKKKKSFELSSLMFLLPAIIWNLWFAVSC